MAKSQLQFSLRNLLLVMGAMPVAIALLYRLDLDYSELIPIAILYIVVPAVAFTGAAALVWRFLGSRSPSRKRRRLGTTVFFILVALSVFPTFMSRSAIRKTTGQPTNSFWWMRMGVPCVWLELPSDARTLVGFPTPEARPRWFIAHGVVGNLLFAAAIAHLGMGAVALCEMWDQRSRDRPCGQNHRPVSKFLARHDF